MFKAAAPWNWTPGAGEASLWTVADVVVVPPRKFVAAMRNS